jgi:hypothetical protein
MKTKYLLGVAGVAGAVVTIGQLTNASTNDAASGKAVAPQTTVDHNGLVIDPQGGGNPDVYVFKISGTANWSSGDMRAYSVGTTSCNEGDAELAWFANNNQHPVIGQNMFRLAPGQNGHLRFEQLGQSWLKHGFCALSQSECGDCQPTSCNTLGIGCSDPYTASRNGIQGSAGPKWQVNATTGFFPYPPADPAFSGQLARRLQVPLSEVLPAENPGAEYFFEAQYVCPDENVMVDIINAADNVSYRKGNLSASGALTSYDGDTVIKQPAVYAWKAADPSVLLQWRALTGEGNFFIASQAYDNGNGTWDYEYVVHNLDSDRSIGSVSIPVDSSVTVSQFGFRDVDYHSGEVWDNTDWANARNSGDVAWNTEAFSDNPNANAIRWGTAYNFRFTADSAPTETEMTLGFFKDGDGAASFTASVKAPISLNICTGDIDGDGQVGFSDLTTVLAEWGFCFNCPEDLNGDFVVDFDDLLTILSAYGPCP